MTTKQKKTKERVTKYIVYFKSGNSIQVSKETAIKLNKLYQEAMKQMIQDDKRLGVIRYYFNDCEMIIVSEIEAIVEDKV